MLSIQHIPYLNFCGLAALIVYRRFSGPKIVRLDPLIHSAPTDHPASRQHSAQSPKLEVSDTQWLGDWETSTLWPSNVLMHLPPLEDWFPIIPLLSGPSCHILMVLSKLPLTRLSPSGANATEYTLSLCPSGPSSRAMILPERTSHTRTLLSRDPAATHSPFGDMATVVTPSSMPSVNTSLLRSMSQTRTV